MNLEWRSALWDLLTSREEELRFSFGNPNTLICAKLISGGVRFPGFCKFGLSKFSARHITYCSNYVTGEQAVARPVDNYVLFFAIDWITNLQNPNKQQDGPAVSRETNRFGPSHTESAEPALQAFFGVSGVDRRALGAQNGTRSKSLSPLVKKPLCHELKL
jgi:hypothetical protein